MHIIAIAWYFLLGIHYDTVYASLILYFIALERGLSVYACIYTDASLLSYI